MTQRNVRIVKVCYRCKMLKPAADFNRSPKNVDGLHSYCRDCQKQHYRDNYDRHLRNVRRTSDARMAKLREYVFEAMRGGCVDCGNRDIRVLEFDHVRGRKIESIGVMVRRGFSREAVEAEIAKCDVRCRNCHVIATLGRLGKTWHSTYLDDA